MKSEDKKMTIKSRWFVGMANAKLSAPCSNTFGQREGTMGGKKISIAFLLAVLLSSLVVADRLGFAQEKEHNRCRQHRFGPFSDWSEPVNLGPVVNSAFNDQHPAISADGLSLYISSDRPGGFC